MSNCPLNLGFLIDENLTPELAKPIASRGFRVHIVARDVDLCGRGDSRIAQFAVEQELVLVTNNAVDFEQIYVKTEYHPGIILVCANHTKLRTRKHQLVMIELALDEIQRDSLCQEVLRITAYDEEDGDLLVRMERYFLPDIDRSSEAA